MKLPSFLMYEEGYPKPKIKEIIITDKTKVWQEEVFYFVGVSGVVYSSKFYFVDDNGAIRLRDTTKKLLRNFKNKQTTDIKGACKKMYAVVDMLSKMERRNGISI